MGWTISIFGPVVVVFFVALFVTNKISLKRNFTPYQAALSFGLLNFGILCLVSFAAIVWLTSLDNGGDRSGSVVFIFLFPIAAVTTFVEMLFAFFILRNRINLNTPSTDSVSNAVPLQPKTEKIAKIIFILIVAFFIYSILSTLIGEHYSNPMKTKKDFGNIIQTQTNFIPTSSSKIGPASKPIIQITSPNGGEIFKIGDKVNITWKANPPLGVWLDFELFEISGDKPNIALNGQCLNCVGGGLRSGVLAISPIAKGVGEIEWSVGKLYLGGYIKPGNHYILKANISKTGSQSECPARFSGCTVDLGVDWSDNVFSLTN